MNMQLLQKMKSLLFIILIFIGLFLLTNTNNNPNAIIQRIFRPIHIGSGAIYYAAIIPILLIYYSLKWMYKQNNFALLNTMTKRIIVLIIILSILPAVTESGIKTYKGFYSDLSSIYCYRNNMKLSIETNENKRLVLCNLDLENCSSKKVKFYAKVKMPKYFDEAKESTIADVNTEIILNPNERRNLQIILDESSINSTGFTSNSINDFEFSLYNEGQEVEFTQSDEAY